MTEVDILIWTAVGAGVFVILYILGMMYLYGIFDRRL